MATAEAAPDTSSTSTAVAAETSAAPASGVTAAENTGGSALTEAIGQNQATSDANAADTARDVSDAKGLPAGDGKQPEAVEGPSTDEILEAAQSLLRSGVDRKQIERLAAKDPDSLILMSTMLGGKDAGAKPAAKAAETVDDRPIQIPGLDAVVPQVAQMLGLSDDQAPVLNSFAQAIAAPFFAKLKEYAEGHAALLEFVENDHIAREAAKHEARYPALKTPEGIAKLREAMANFDGKRFRGQFGRFVASAADAAFARDWLGQRDAKKAELDKAKARSNPAISKSPPKTYTEDELATQRIRLLQQGLTREQMEAKIAEMQSGKSR